MGGYSLPDIKTPDVRLLSAWAIIATVLALAALWQLVNTCFQLGVLAHSPKLGRLKQSESRSPAVLAGHFTSVANAVVCVAAFLPVAIQRLEAGGWSPGALLPLWSRPLAIGPPLPGTSTFYLSLAAYCLQTSLASAERVVNGATGERLVLLQRVLLFLLASSICMVECVPELSLAVLLLEVPSPFVALWQALQDFRLRSDPLYGGSGYVAVFAILKWRLILFGGCVVCAISHAEARKKLGGDRQRCHMMILCIALLAAYGAHFARLCREVNRIGQDNKESRRASDLQV